MAFRMLAALLVAAARARQLDPVVARPVQAGARAPREQEIQLSQLQWDQLRETVVTAPAQDNLRGHSREDWSSRYPMGLTTLQFIMNVSREIPINIEGLSHEEARTATGIVTHTGKNNMDYIDHAVLLGRALKKHVPEYPMVAIAVEGMSEVNQELLRKAGWHVVLVEDWGPEHCKDHCASKLLGRWDDSLEKLHAFRLPFGKALFLDADTYVFSGAIRDVLERSNIQAGQIAMVQDTCKQKGDKDEFNSGLMFYEPDMTRFARMLNQLAQHGAGDVGDIPGQRIINEEFRDQVVQLHDKFDCMDLFPEPRVRGCPAKCQEDMVVAHFTGLPKPARAVARWLGMIREGAQNISPSSCEGTNHGWCYKYRDFYCDMAEEASFLSVPLQKAVREAGACARPQPLALLDRGGLPLEPALLIKALGGGSPVARPFPVDLGRWAGPTKARARELVHAEVQSLVGARNLTIAAFARSEDQGVSGDLIAGKGWETKHSRELCQTFQRHGGVGNFLDIGGNIGTFTIPLADCLAHAGPGRRPSRVVAVEAMPPTADHLLAGIKWNNLTNVDVYNYAVGAPTDGRNVTMSLNPVNKGGSAVKGNKPFTEMDDQQLQDLFHPGKAAKKFAQKVEVKEYSVELTTADNMLDLNPAMKALLIAKVDIEGHEGHFIKGAKTLFSKFPPCYMTIELVPEWLERAGTPAQEVLDLLTSWGYKNVPTVETISKGPIESKTRTVIQKDMTKCIARIWSNLPSNFMAPTA